MTSIFSLSAKSESIFPVILFFKESMFKSLISLTKCSTPTSSASKALTEQGIFLKFLSTNPFLLTDYSAKNALVGN